MKRRYGSLLSVLPALCLMAAGSPVLPSPALADSPPVRAAIREDSGSVTLPFTSRDGHLYVEATVNGKQARFVFDTGADANIVTPEGASRLGLPRDGGTVAGQGAGAAITAQRTRVDRLEMGKALLENEAAYIIPLPVELDCDGLLGRPLLTQFVITLDYENNRLTLTDPKKFRPAEGAARLDLVFNGTLPAVDGEMDGIRARFHLDSGAQGALTLFTPFVERHRLREKYSPRIETIVGKGAGGYLYGDITRISKLTLGGIEIPGVITDLSRQKEGVFANPNAAGNIGAGILQRFTVTFDYSHKRLYLAKNGKFTEPFPVTRSGLGVDQQGTLFKVIVVMPASPAAEAGIQIGDTLLAVDGVGVDKLDAYKIRARFREAAGTRLELLVRTGESGTPRKAVVTLRDLL